MTDWETVLEDIRTAGYEGFTRESGVTAVPGVAGEWVAGAIQRTGELQREHQPVLMQVMDQGSGDSVTTDEAAAPSDLRAIADRHGLEVAVLTVSRDRLQVALCDPA